MKNAEENIRSEVQNLKLAGHPKIIRFIDYHETETFYCIFQEYFQGDSLLQYVNMHKPLSEDQAKKIFFQLLSAVNFLHKNDISHRDIKFENVLIDNNLNIKLIDFGLSIFGNQLLTTYCGSLYYAAPECLLYQPYSGFSADMWSLGVVLFGMITGQLPWMDQNLNAVRSKIIESDYSLPNEIPDCCANIISRLLILNPDNRMSADECFIHPWFNLLFVKDMKQFHDFSENLQNDQLIQSQSIKSNSASNQHKVQQNCGRKKSPRRKTQTKTKSREHPSSIILKSTIIPQSKK